MENALEFRDWGLGDYTSLNHRLTFGGREEPQRGRDERVDVIEAARPRRSQEGFQFGEREFDRIEVGTVGREEPELRARPLEGHPDLGLLVDREVVEHDDIARPQRGHQHLFDIGEETGTINGPIEDGWRAHPFEAQRGDDRVRLPVTARRVIAEPRAARTPAVAP